MQHLEDRIVLAKGDDDSTIGEWLQGQKDWQGQKDSTVCYDGLFVQGLRPWTSDFEVQRPILSLPKHGITTMTLRPLHLGLIYWKEEILMALHSMWTRWQKPKLLLSLEAPMVMAWTLLNCSLMGNGKQVLFNAESKSILISSSAIFV